MQPLKLVCSVMFLAGMLACRDDGVGRATTPIDPPFAKGGPPSSGAAMVQLPSLARGAEAWGVDPAGTTIVGHSLDRRGNPVPVEWTLQNGTWTISILPNVQYGFAKAVNDDGDAAGYISSALGSHAFLWPGGGPAVTLGCAETGLTQVWGISEVGQVVVGTQAGNGSVWTPGSCRETLPALANQGSQARAVNANGTVIGGASPPTSDATSSVPVRWTGGPGARQIEALDTRAGSVQGGNAAGDFAGNVKVSCSVAGGCDHAIVWYATGGVNELTALTPLGETSVATDVNSAGEVVGYIATGTQTTAYFWSAQLGVVLLPSRARGGAAARALSDPRADGSRLVVGTSGTRAAVWVVQNQSP